MQGSPVTQVVTPVVTHDCCKSSGLTFPSLGSGFGLPSDQEVLGEVWEGDPGGLHLLSARKMVL